jgi:hypothetical protein
MKKYLYAIMIIMAAAISGCLESDEFDGLTDTRPKASINFPGRQYDQNVGLAVRITGFSSVPNVVVPMEVAGGGNVSISKILLVEARGAKLPTPGACTNYAVIQADAADIDDTRSYSYSVPLSTLTGNATATCAAGIVGAGMYYEFIFTLEMSDGSTVVTMPVRVQIVE